VKHYTKKRLIYFEEKAAQTIMTTITINAWDRIGTGADVHPGSGHLFKMKRNITANFHAYTVR
jgi:hypothetical protein